jgi:hypothetical protein
MPIRFPPPAVPRFFNEGDADDSETLRALGRSRASQAEGTG